ncbi:hypothetical protein EJ05DRAFT_363835 [Pseudovirgaria hyperparasitica]|uniref:Uncharacterized protein n=1 Tax=Pseudovirgaria hyperparasitica TaxID=470096 RepID=A0A6A6W7B0_9PEZI|nr:uncharacterized protein EJ05DRAFT_363835 [Pseudovirgaria hyperparasitica]KAF2758778.1 hypothetical protein EJ05DRAFT_363835 [Pseudovirgaria hyperparasitica]
MRCKKGLAGPEDRLDRSQTLSICLSFHRSESHRPGSATCPFLLSSLLCHPVPLCAHSTPLHSPLSRPPVTRHLSTSSHPSRIHDNLLRHSPRIRAYQMPCATPFARTLAHTQARHTRTLQSAATD